MTSGLVDYHELGLRHAPPLSARRLPPELPDLLSHLVTQAAHVPEQPFVGITTDGAVRTGLFPLEPTHVSTRPLVDAGLTFLAALDDEQRRAVTFPVDADEWRQWCNVHIYLFRHGLLLEDLTAPQRHAALELVRASFSARGFDTVRDVMRFNEVLADISGSPDEYGEWAFWLTIFGTPSDDGPWGWQLDGHHLNLHCFVLGDQLVLTPAFFGAEPCHVTSGPYTGMRIFADEERTGLAMVRSLSTDQARTAILYPSIMSADIPPERRVPIDGQMMAGAFQDNRRMAYEGLRADAMTDAQRTLLRRLIDTYVGHVRDGHAAVRMDEVAGHFDETHFCWMGGTDDVSPFYYKVQSPVILIEFDHEPGVVFANDEPTRHHVHAIVRTPNGNDYGIDLLRQHYEQAGHHAKSRR
ncbi:MAG TPA: DUF3500 domain-containing protein [Acidimicrobiales bacterium]|nr:DUF3500 domain-containing protein [Acidimicrobiales bacterium]